MLKICRRCLERGLGFVVSSSNTCFSCGARTEECTDTEVAKHRRFVKEIRSEPPMPKERGKMRTPLQHFEDNWG